MFPGEPPLPPPDQCGLHFLTNYHAGLLVSYGRLGLQPMGTGSGSAYEIRQFLASHPNWSSSTLNRGLTMHWLRESEILTHLQFGTLSET